MRLVQGDVRRPIASGDRPMSDGAMMSTDSPAVGGASRLEFDRHRAVGGNPDGASTVTRSRKSER